MGMTIEDCIHKLDFIIGAYQKLIDENVANGEVVGTGVRGTWTASTPLNKAYSNMIEALQIAKDTLRKHQMMQADYENRLKADMAAMLTEIQLEIEEKFNDRPFSYNHHQRTEFYRDIDEVIQQKINSLKEAKDG
jgi:hypothetical protein